MWNVSWDTVYTMIYIQQKTLLHLLKVPLFGNANNATQYL